MKNDLPFACFERKKSHTKMYTETKDINASIPDTRNLFQILSRFKYTHNTFVQQLFFDNFFLLPHQHFNNYTAKSIKKKLLQKRNSNSRINKILKCKNKKVTKPTRTLQKTPASYFAFCYLKVL